MCVCVRALIHIVLLMEELQHCTLSGIYLKNKSFFNHFEGAVSLPTLCRSDYSCFIKVSKLNIRARTGAAYSLNYV